MTFTHYQKAGDKVFAVNPYTKKFSKHEWDAFEAWLSTQPPIYTDPSIKDGVMYKVDELEIVWQFRLRGFDTKWQNVDNQVYERNTFHTYSDYCETMGAFSRQYATLKQPDYKSYEYYEQPTGKWWSCGMDIKAYQMQGIEIRLKQPVKQEENYKGEAYYKNYIGELLDIFYYRFYEGHGHLSDVPENLKREAFYEWLNEQIKNTTY